MSDEKKSKINIANVVAASELWAINLRACVADCNVYPTFITPETTQLQITTAIDWNCSDGKDLLFCYVSSTVVGNATRDLDAAKKDAQLFKVSVQVSVVYRLSDQNLSDSELEAFAKVNGRFHAHPYLRETVANLTNRMGIAAVMLPVLKPKKEKESKDSPAL